MEPSRNARVVQTQRRTFYNFTRRYGEALYIYKVTESSTDYTTGEKTKSYDRAFVRNAVHVPSTTARNVTYTPAMMQAVRQYAWQGGAGTDQEMTTFLIADRDLRGWCKIDPTQRISWHGNSYQVKEVQDFEGGVVVHCVLVRGSGPANVQDNDIWTDCNSWSD